MPAGRMRSTAPPTESSTKTLLVSEVSPAAEAQRARTTTVAPEGPACHSRCHFTFDPAAVLASLTTSAPFKTLPRPELPSATSHAGSASPSYRSSHRLACHARPPLTDH